MYWRIRKITPDVLVGRLGVYAVLIVSLIFNLFLFTRANASKAITAPQQDFYTNFAKQVTRHLFDASYLTVEDSMNAINIEVKGPALAKLRQQEIIPKDEESLKAIVRELSDSQSVSTLRFDNIVPDKPVASGNMAGCLPIDLKIHVVVHDNEGVRPTNIRMRYYIRNELTPKTGESHPVLYDFEQLKDQG